MADPRNENTVLTMARQLSVEEVNKPAVISLLKGHRVIDISTSLEERKSGTDFLLSVCNRDGTEHLPIRCENKFDQYITGNVVLELVSVDRRRVPGWMYTSQAGWLWYWFRNTGDLFACPFADLRALVLPNITRRSATTALNKGYLSWNVLEDMNYLLEHLDNARVLNLRREIGDKPEQPTRVSIRGQKKRCTVEELLELMKTLPATSIPPSTPTAAQLEDTISQLAPLNRKAEHHADLISRLTFLKRAA